MGIRANPHLRILTPKRFGGCCFVVFFYITIDEETTKAEFLKGNINEKMTTQKNIIWRVKIHLDSMKKGSRVKLSSE